MKRCLSFRWRPGSHASEQVQLRPSNKPQVTACGCVKGFRGPFFLWSLLAYFWQLSGQSRALRHAESGCLLARPGISALSKSAPLVDSTGSVRLVDLR